MTAKRRARSFPNEQKLRLMKPRWAFGLTFVAAVLAAGGTFYGLMVLLDFREIDSTAKLDAKTLFDLVKLSFGVVAGAGALVALVVAYRRQRVDETGAHREATRLHTERFSQAVDKLGSDSPAVRLGGVHALAGLADDAPDHNLRQTCIDVLCAYLQLPFTPDPGDDPARQEEHHRYLAFRKVRHTILRLIGDHYRRPQAAQRSWQGCDLDLTGVTIDCSTDFSSAVFSGSRVSFDGAVFSGGMVSFADTVFSGGMVSFADTVFSGSIVSFADAAFSGGMVSFHHTVFSEGRVSFDCAAFSGGKVSFPHTVFSGGKVSFSDATFSGGWVLFHDAAFSGGRVSFDGAAFSTRTVSFDGAAFSTRTVSFRRAVFSAGTVSFDDAAFSASSTVSFARTEFSGATVSFDRATFSHDAVSFSVVSFLDGQVSFSDATGPAPSELLTAVIPDSVSVALPSAWLPANP
ncbi:MULTISPECIES: pentapeptide repeat-containing protein [unclassified Streptomyces]|uniref:pentapeptide repeat-containing protein n=1 Tax=unclassified Streptomyces TaxID=2593676 RepID=UPI002F9090FC|nr:pentapeptide repeat-containing protein [Streptomyces sp. NBC_01174]